MTVTTPAGRLVCAFGNVEKMSALYAPEIEWSLSASLPYPRPMKGREAVLAFNRSVWEEVYFPDCTVEILDELGDERLSAVRFIYRAKYRGSNLPYENEYTLFARGGRRASRRFSRRLIRLQFSTRCRARRKALPLRVSPANNQSR
jgi:hypothetical protein